MIYIICGTCGTSKGYKTKADGTFSLPAAEEKRLVRRGVAAYVTKPILSHENGSASLGESVPGADLGVTTSDSGDGAGAKERDEGDIPAEACTIPDVLDIVDGHFTKESLLQMSRKDMESLAVDLGVDVRKCKNKNEIADILVGVELTEAEADDEDSDDGAGPPDLGVEAPVV